MAESFSRAKLQSVERGRKKSGRPGAHFEGFSFFPFSFPFLLGDNAEEVFSQTDVRVSAFSFPSSSSFL